MAPDLDIQVDGGIKAENIKAVQNAGANVFVVGSGIFAAEDAEKATQDLVKIIG